ncbi:pyridoxal-phosphate dependent enzyme, partial [Staphylococcus saprophyticus]|uniref:pyridoxal-phosphate dependent enzyme n=1 Tax=Staphylococcus saprophyticus TaxID=29385 RepID=UPI0011A52CA6
GDSFEEWVKEGVVYSEENKMKFIERFNNIYSIGGEGRLGKEIVEECKDKEIELDYLFGGMGGGGLICGVGSYLKTEVG